MTLLNLINIIELTAINHTFVNEVVSGDIYKLNELPSIKYGVFAWVQGLHNVDASSTLCKYEFTFFYVDRLNEAESNEVNVQSCGISTITQILASLEDENIDVSSHSFQVFRERFKDLCAGVFCKVILTVPMEVVCP